MKTIFILKMKKKSCGIKTDAGADDINRDIFTLPYIINLLLLTQEGMRTLIYKKHTKLTWMNSCHCFTHC